MTNGPPSSAAGSSKSSTPYAVSSNGSGNAAYTTPFASWPPPQPVPATTSTPVAQPVNTQATQPPTQARSYYRDTTYNAPAPTPALARKHQPTYATKQLPVPVEQPPVIQNVPEKRSPTPPAPAPETYKHWDNAIKTFLVRAKLTQALHGLENDMLVLNPEWEQNVVPEALRGLLKDLQHVLDRVDGKQKAENMDVDIESTEVSTDEEPLEERKLEYASRMAGKTLRPQSSINKSISQFLAKTRARNDATNRSEFLYTLAEKKRKLQEELGAEAAAEVEISSCARVDAKPIDRDKQMKYDIAKNGEGPLTRTVKSQTAPEVALHVPSGASHAYAPAQPSPLATSSSISSGDASNSTKKRKADVLEDADSNPTIAKGKGKARAYENDDPEGEDYEQAALAAATPEKHPGLDERLKNIETHLALRYVPTPPRTLLARLKYLEDHIVRLEKEYPPWAALHFNQPDRGWPAPPRATPIIVPPQLRSALPPAAQPPRPAVATASNTAPAPAATSSVDASTGASGAGMGAPQAGPALPVIPKTRRPTSSLQQAILDRLEVQRAMNELNNSRGS